MANDIDMYQDIERVSKRGSTAALDLWECYKAKFIDGNMDLAQKLKAEFTSKYGYWGNYY